MTIDRSGVPFLGAASTPAIILLLAGRPMWSLPFLALAGFFLFFFRDPERQPPSDTDAVLAPADGRVLVAGGLQVNDAPAGTWQQISIFLSPLNVHVNRTPVAGRVTRVEHNPGRFFPAYRHEAATDNERTEVWIDSGGRSVICRQIVGFLARRIVCRVGPGAEVQAGERFGIMKFGSRIDLFVPEASALTVKPGDSVRGGETVVAVLPRPSGLSTTPVT